MSEIKLVKLLDGINISIDTDGLLNNYTAIVAPAVTDDLSSGYNYGSQWIDTASGDSYILVDPANNNAVWERTSTSGAVTGDTTFPARIDEAGGILIGQAVFVAGAVGSAIEISLASNDVFTESNVLALASESGVDNATITCITSGIIEGVDTSSFSEGDILYLGLNGDLTNVHPDGIVATVRVGYAVRINASTGSVFVQITSQTISNDHVGTVRHSLVNENVTGTTAYTLVNDEGRRMSINLSSSGAPFTPDLASIYVEGYGDFQYTLDGNKDHIWLTDVGDTHDFSATEKMRLNAAGKLLINQIEALTTNGDLVISVNGTGNIIIGGRNIVSDGSTLDTHVADATIHRSINDTGASTTDLWSADKIATEIAASSGGVLNNFSATTDPLVTNDSGSGYAVGSRWINVTEDRGFICVDASVGAAKWYVDSGAELLAAFTTVFFLNTAGYNSLDYVAFAGDSNSIELPVGRWLVFGTMKFVPSSGVITDVIGRWSAGNGDNTGATPPEISADPNFTLVGGDNQAWYLASGIGSITPMNFVIIDVSGTGSSVFLNCLFAFSSAGGSNIDSSLSALRLR